MERLNISFLAMIFILLFAVIGFILVVFDLHRFAFVLELMLLLAFIFILAFAMFAVYHGRKWGWTMLAAVLMLLLVDLFFIFLLTGIFETPHITALFFSAVGILLALFNLGPSRSYRIIEEEYEKTKDYYPYIDKMEPVQKTEEPITKTFTPGKYIASKKSAKYHIAKCDWAKRISKENRLWFNSEEEAKSQGFIADVCIAA
ncbi:hypothetical protein HYX07_04245 [Candidatus Woesearchaeota archaeon]|nr:hypothetical protein [Candidatus Woesearchaeota archaeon]